MSFKHFMKELGGEHIEGEIITSVFVSLLSSFLILAVLYAVKLRFIDNFMSKYSFFLLLAVISYAFVMPTIRHVRAFKDWLCMPGMMIGMTTGMIAGFLPGFYVASTNGMFIGSVFGMLIGILLGIWNGKCCGIMGVMEGVMAGFMGGLMGAMTAFMLLNDHLRISTIIVSGIGVSILIMLYYMMHLETKEVKRESKESYALIIVVSIILTVITTWLMVLGPRSGVFG